MKISLSALIFLLISLYSSAQGNADFFIVVNEMTEIYDSPDKNGKVAGILYRGDTVYKTAPDIQNIWAVIRSGSNVSGYCPASAIGRISGLNEAVLLKAIKLENHDYQIYRDEACRSGYMETVKYLAERDLKSKKDEYIGWGVDPYILAFNNGHNDIINYMKEKGISKYGLNDFDLYISIKEKKYDAVYKRSDIFPYDLYTPMNFAIECNDIILIKNIAEKYRNVFIDENFHFYSIFLNACRLNRTEIIKFFLSLNISSMGEDIRFNDNWGYNALNYCVQNGNIEIIALLLKIYGANFFSNRSSTSYLETNALYEAVKGNNFEIVKMLVESYFDVNIEQYRNTDNFNLRINESPLKIALSNNNLEIAQYLIDHGAKTDIRLNYDGMDFLTYYSLTGNLKIVKFLIKNNIDVNHKISDSGAGVLDFLDENFINGLRKNCLLSHTLKYWNKDINYEPVIKILQEASSAKSGN